MLYSKFFGLGPRFRRAFYARLVIEITKGHRLVNFKALALLEQVLCNKLCFTLATSNGLASSVVAFKTLESSDRK